MLQTQEEMAVIDDFRFNLISVQRLIIDAETSQRRYLITNNPTFLDPYENGQEKVNEKLKTLENSEIDMPDLSRKIMQLRNLSDEKFRIIDASIQVQLHAGAYASHLTLSKDKGRIVMENINSTITDIDAWLKLLKDNISENAQFILTKVILGSVLLIIVISGILLFSYRRTV